MAAVPCSVELHRSSSTQLEWYFHRKHAHYKVQMYNNKKKALKNLMDRKKENPLLRGGGWIISYEWALALITTRKTITIKMQLIFVSAIYSTRNSHSRFPPAPERNAANRMECRSSKRLINKTKQQNIFGKWRFHGNESSLMENK